mgnify:CR=1 FL=1
MAIEDDELVDPDPEVPEMGLGEEDEILMPKNSKDLGFDETDPTESGLKETEEEEEGEI